MLKVYTETYGCTLNKGDTEIILNLLRSLGITETDKLEDADIVLINTCTVRKDTEEHMLKRIRELYTTYPNKKLIIAGCLATAQPYTIRKITPKAYIITTYDVTRIIKVLGLRASYQELGKRELYTTIRGPIVIVPVADGCTGMCSFCITRIARPSLVSYPINKIVNRVKESVENGAREIQLTAQDLGGYGLDLYGRRMLIELVREIIDIPGDFMIRLGMMNPEHLVHFIDELIEVLRNPKVYKFLHIPLQSGDDRMLKLMNRKYTVDDYRYIVKYVRSKIPDIMIATDIIVGHPGEDEEAFNNTLKILKELEIERVHLAQYTPRPRTLSATLPQIPPHIRKYRSMKLLKLIEEIGGKTHRKYIGSIVRALVIEKGVRNTFVARTQSYYPVILDKPIGLGEWVYARIVDATYYDLRGIVLS